MCRGLVLRLAQGYIKGFIGLWIVSVRAMVLLEVALLIKAQSLPGESRNIRYLFSLSAVDGAHLSQSVRLNDVAEENMLRMSVTLDTSHLERSPLNDDAE